MVVYVIMHCDHGVITDGMVQAYEDILPKNADFDWKLVNLFGH